MASNVKLFLDKDSMVEDMSLIPLLFPYLGAVFKESNLFVSRAFRDHGFTKEGFELVDAIEACDYVVVPHIYGAYQQKYPNLLAALLKKARSYGKKLLIDASGDIESPVNIPDAEVLRIGSYRFLLHENEIAIPVPVEDFLELYAGGVLPLRTKREQATVGFAGWARLPFVQYWKATLKALPYRLRSLADSRYGAFEKGALLRSRVLRMLLRAKRVHANLIIRDSYSAHVKTVKGDFATVRREFVDNLLASDYALSVRGDANADTRFYEAISLGRIPIFIDTERVMPLMDIIDYREFCLVVDFHDIERLEGIIADFHASLTPERFVEMQKRAREVFEQYLRNDSFTKHLANILRARLVATTV